MIVGIVKKIEKHDENRQDVLGEFVRSGLATVAFKAGVYGRAVMDLQHRYIAARRPTVNNEN